MSVERALIHQLDEPSPVTLLIFVDYGESLETAAIREAKEETNLSISILGPLGAYSDPNRDARLHTISYVFKTTG